ncbi:MAG: hypothetical protein SGPRY_003541, partial [Prymnesium sp.]
YRYGSSAWYNSASAGGKLVDMQFAWAIITFICGCIGIWVYLCWKEDINLSRGRLIFRQKVFYYFSFFAWAFGVWTTAVLFASFKNYSLRPGIYPGDLTGCFLVMACTLLFQDLWALSKLCSLGTYTAKLAEEWRYQVGGQAQAEADGGQTALDGKPHPEGDRAQGLPLRFVRAHDVVCS